MSLKRLTLIWMLVILLAVVPSKQASVRERFPKGASGSAPRQAEGKTANQNPQFGNSVQNPAIRDADRGNSSFSRGVPDAALSPEVEDFKNYSGWRILRVYPPDAVALDDLVAMLLDMSQLVVLGIFKEKMVVEVALPGNATLDEAMPESRFSFCGFDGQRKGGSLLRGKGEMCGSDASGKDIGNSTSGSDVGKEVVGWETLKTIEDDYATKLDGTEPFAWDNFYRYESIVTFIKELALQYSGVEYIEIGRSVEGRSLYALLFAKKAKSLKKKYLRNIKKERRRNKTGRKPFPKLKNSTGRNKKPVVLMEGAAHAREWISPAVATYLAQQLADSGKTFLKRVTVILVPVLNPDGYEYSHTTDRLWRKNRRPNSGSGCTGVDLNRNFDMAFGNPSGSSDDPCSPIYHGAEAFSEPETSALRDLAGAFSKDVNIYISLHSYGKLIMYPWSYIYGSAPNRKQLKDVARKMSRHFKNNGYKGFLHGQSSSLLYKASGVSDDYMYSVGVDYSYTIELQGLDFIMKPKHIVPVSEAMWNTLVCSIGDISNTKAVKRFCGKRLVKTTLGDGATASGWFRRRVSLRRAEQIIRCKNLAKKRGISSDSDDSCKYRKGKRTHNKR
ncbi:molting fluid carboxypeptidase A precursor [Penaeus vannamei]|uniref:Molting fluid carboxypeptidase A n=1 Tax=Penaeus vannamei TaxID=6689 RepID=A0A3R7LXS1_PENVA|nr:mast cell carboxypeptidase A-like [Penaeus vannamei]ROT62030.1 molting fluid carboxypeptidase A precursor [Penaeus vannamei]